MQHDGIPEDDVTHQAAQMEAIVRQARQTFGETLPRDFLSEAEYKIYERLYGPPLATTIPEDVELPRDDESEEFDGSTPQNVLMRENRDGNLEEIVFDEDDLEDEELYETVDEAEVSDQPEEAVDHIDPSSPAAKQEFRSRLDSLRAKFAANSSAQEHPLNDLIDQVHESRQGFDDLAAARSEETLASEDQEIIRAEDEAISDRYDEEDEGDTMRAHPLTTAGQYGTSPSTIQLPKSTFVEPIAALLADAANKHLMEVAERTFGGPGLPHSTATMKRPNLKQESIPLEAGHGKMAEMEANAYLAAIYPGAYASTMNTLVEVRKRLGSKWLHSLMSKKDGPRILDAGAAGAAVLAWRDIISAEYDALHPEIPPKSVRPPFGRSTVVTGSNSLRTRASALLDDTTFIPRLPDYNPSRDHPSLEPSNPQPRKQYDLIVAPYTLWSLKEDHMRKSQIQNFWSLLDPRGGVLILIEKGVSRGFELIAGARETLLKYHVSSPGSEQVEHTIEDASQNRFGPKEKGMIIAPCTNHGKCPMYITAGRSQGRKDFCHFNQRFIHPPFLQNILGHKDRNHEDVQFSYVALQRGRDQRHDQRFEQGQKAADAAFAGFEDEYDESAKHQKINPLALPRAILPPIKRRGHVILDLCTPAGKIERWTVPRSFSKQGYRDARKSRWGDLWGLGAKTRVARNIRVGLKKQGTAITRNVMHGMEDVEEQPMDLGDEAGPSKPRKGKAKNGGRRHGPRSGKDKYPKKAMQEMQDDL